MGDLSLIRETNAWDDVGSGDCSSVEEDEDVHLEQEFVNLTVSDGNLDVLKEPFNVELPHEEEISASDDGSCMEYEDYASQRGEVLNLKVPERDPNVLKEILTPVIPSNLEKQARVETRKSSAFYFLLGHTVPHTVPHDHILDNSDSYTVASLYRVEIECQTDDTTATRSLGSPLFSFTSDKYPLGMGYGAIGSKLFFVGGDSHALRPAAEGGHPHNKLYVLDTSSIDSSTTHDDIAELLEVKNSPYLNKSNPIVVTIDNKLFVLPSNFGAINGINPTIESYDPAEGEWKSFDVFEKAHDGSLKECPSLLPIYTVLRHFVEKSVLYIILVTEAYAFDYRNERLYLLRDGVFCSMPPFVGSIVHPDGCFFGLDDTVTQLFAYKKHPTSGYLYDSWHSFVLSDFAYENGQGVISHLGDVGEENRLLVLRSSNGFNATETSEELILVFDFTSVVKEAEGTLKCKTYSIAYQLDCGCGYIQACFPI